MNQVQGAPKGNVFWRHQPTSARSSKDAAATAERLDSVAKVLAGATAAAAALLTTFGLTSDRVWLLLDQDRLAKALVFTGIGAVLAIGCSLLALLLPPWRYGWQAFVLGAGALLYIGSLVCVLLVAGEAGDRAGAPLIESATIQTQGEDRFLDVHVVGQQVDSDQSASVSVELGSAILYASSIPPDFEGKIDQSVVVPLSAGTEGETLKVTAWRTDKGEPDCSHIRGYGPSCLTIEASP